MIGVLCSMSLLLSMAHLPTLTLSLLSLGADRSCGSPMCIVVTGGTWGLQLTLVEHPAYVSSLGVHGSAARITLPPRQSWCTVSRIGGGATLPPHCCGWDRMWLQLTLAEGILAAASSWPSLGSLTLSSWLGSHAAHSLGRESQRWHHGWDHTQSASEWW